MYLGGPGHTPHLSPQRCHSGDAVALQRKSNPACWLLEGKALLWHHGKELFQSPRLTVNMEIHSYSGRPSGNEDVTDGRTEQGMSLHDQFHLFKEKHFSIDRPNMQDQLN